MSTISTQPTSNGYKPGLEGVVAAETRLSHVDGLKGELIIGGYSVEEIAAKATFEETVYLLWHDRLPTPEELAAFAAKLTALRTLPEAASQLIASLVDYQLPVMDILRIVAGVADVDQPDADLGQRAMMLLARLPTIVASYWRLRHALAPLPPDPALNHAANYLYMLTGNRPDEGSVRGLETYLNTVVDHGLNASTFAARVIIATQTDLTSAIVGAIGALKGPLHGGAPGPALEMVFEIGSVDRAERVIREKLSRGERLMGFGHRVYKVRDPRAEVLSIAAAKMFQTSGDTRLYLLAKEVEETAIRLLEEHKPGRNLQTNVEFYTALLLHGLGMESELFTPTFAIARAGGWIAHCFEQLQSGRLIRPQSRYVGRLVRSA